MKKFLNWAVGILAVIMLLALLLKFDFVAEPVAKMIGSTADKVKMVATTALWVSIGLYLVSTGVAALTIPVVGIILIAVGLTLLVLGLYPWFSGSSANGMN